jgi:hypothetical protein
MQQKATLFIGIQALLQSKDSQPPLVETLHVHAAIVTVEATDHKVNQSHNTCGGVAGRGVAPTHLRPQH